MLDLVFIPHCTRNHAIAYTNWTARAYRWLFTRCHLAIAITSFMIIINLAKWCLQHVKFATKTYQIRTVFSGNFETWDLFISFVHGIPGLQIVKYFSHEHKLHFLVTFVYDFACFALRYLIVYFTFFSFKLYFVVFFRLGVEDEKGQALFSSLEAFTPKSREKQWTLYL